MESFAVQLEGVRRVFRGTRRTGPRTALDGVSLSVAPGAWVALLGPNGSGKSTLLRLAGALDAPTEGVVRWFDNIEESLQSRRARIGVVMQTTTLDPLLTGRENLLLQGAVFGMTRAEREDRIVTIGDELAIATRLDDRVGALSGGLARRVDLARALLPDPELLLLDEATAGLDPPARDEFLRAVEARRAATGLTVMMSTHLMEEAERADRVIMIDEGRLVADGAPAALRHELGAPGGVAIRAPREALELLRECGVEASIANGEAAATIGRSDADCVARTVLALAEAGHTVRLGSPTLEDVFMAKTGHALRTERSGA